MVKNIILIIISSFVSLIFIEIFSRYYFYNSLTIKDNEANLYQSHDLYGWNFTEGNHPIWRAGNKINVNINSDGFRGQDIRIKLENKRKNIIFLGDSATAGVQVKDSETFSHLIEELSEGKYNTFNFGVDGYSTDQSYLVLKNYIDKIKPEYIFYTFVLNDLDYLFEDNLSHGCCSWGKPYFDKNFDLHNKTFDKKIVNYKKSSINLIKDFFRSNVVIYRLLAKIKHTYKGPGCLLNDYNDNELFTYTNIDDFKNTRDNFYYQNLKTDENFDISIYDNLHIEYISRWKQFELILKNINELAKEHSSELIILNFMDPFQASKIVRESAQECTKLKLDFMYPNKKLELISKKLGIVLLTNDFHDNDNFQRINNCTINFMSKNGNVVDGHYTACGHMMHANMIKNFIGS